jgi:predicted DNA-binding transcriptional regulator YafY
MRKATDTLSRQWVMLQKVPAYPRRISTKDMHDYLRDEGHRIDIRTTQRDLERLSVDFPLACHKDGRTNYWQWGKGAYALEVPSMTPSTALVFQLVEQYLWPLLPHSTLKLLQPYLGRASEVLTSQFRNWQRNVRMISRGSILIPPEIDDDVQRVVYSALLERRQFTVYYRPRETNDPVEYVVNPIGLVIRDGISYLIATLWNYDDIKHLALHRMRFAALSEQPARRRDGFSLDEYITNEAGFSYPVSKDKLQLEVRFESAAAFHLRESKLSADQQIEEIDDGHVLLTATVPDSSEIRWWLLGFGDQVEVLGPEKLREEFALMARNLAGHYS